MAVPKRKTSPSKRGMRRSADALKRPTYVEDKDSGELRKQTHGSRWCVTYVDIYFQLLDMVEHSA